MVVELYRLIALNSLPGAHFAVVAHFAVGHSIARSSAKQGHGYSLRPYVFTDFHR
jgi:hypothetical protein